MGLLQEWHWYYSLFSMPLTGIWMQFMFRVILKQITEINPKLFPFIIYLFQVIYYDNSNRNKFIYDVYIIPVTRGISNNYPVTHSWNIYCLNISKIIAIWHSMYTHY